MPRLTTEGLLSQESTHEVSLFYKKCGFPLNGKNILPDHIGLELEFMFHLTEKGKKKEKDEFLKKHLGNWAEKFFTLVYEETNSPFYKEMAELGKRFIALEINDKGCESWGRI